MTDNPRFPVLAREEMSDRQLEVVGEITSGKRGTFRGPFVALIHSPDAAAHLQRLGEYLRFDQVVPQRVYEVAVLTVAAKLDCANMLASHRRLALASGIDAETIDDIAAGRSPAKLDGEQRCVRAFAMQLLETGNVDDPTFAAAVETWGHRGAAELIVLVGYYVTLSYVYRVAQFPVENGAG